MKSNLEKVKHAYSTIDELNSLFHSPCYKSNESIKFHVEYQLGYVFEYLKALINDYNIYDIDIDTNELKVEVIDLDSLLENSAYLIRMLSEYALEVLKGNEAEVIRLKREMWKLFNEKIGKVVEND